MSSTLSLTPASFAPLAQWLMLVVDGLKKAFSARAGRDRSLGPLSLLLWNRLGRLTNRFQALLARLEAGHPAPPRRQRPTRPARPAPATSAA